MMQTVQLAIADGMYAAALREALSRSCAWHVESVGRPDPSQHCVMVLDQSALERLPLPLSNPERIVLITHKDAQLMAEAWEAGIVSVVSEQDPISTVLLAIMAAGLRVENPTDPHPRAEFPPLAGLYMRHYPQNTGIPDPNAAKLNSLAGFRLGLRRAFTFSPERRLETWTAHSKN